MARKVAIDASQSGNRLDVIAVKMYPALSRAYVRKLIEDGRVLLNGTHAKPGYKLRNGDVITSDFTESELEKIPEINLPIIYEDDDVLVVDKPVGVISHSRSKYWNEASVASFVRQKTQQVGLRAGIVHRLDKATSGVMICAKNELAMKHLQKQFSLRKVEKIYTAVVSGRITKKAEALIDVPIERNPKAPAKFRAGPNGKPSQTKYTVVKSFQGHTLVRLQPYTGRTHQLRVHLSYIGYPIVGDELYGGEESDRLYLHASELEITLLNNTMRFKSSVPESFDKFFK